MIYQYSSIHCINPDCQRPYPQAWGNKFCNSCGAPLQLIDRYYPIRLMAAGGFAHIFTVWDDKTKTEKVLKVLVESSPKALELFTQEAEVLKELQYSGVPKVEADGYFQINITNPKSYHLPCLVMEKINGQNLDELLHHYPQGLPEDLVLTWLIQAIKILQELHKRQIIHRDIKPSNLMLRQSASIPIEENDQLVLIDFGGAKQFSGSILRSQRHSTRLYSSGYSPPEQVSGGNVGPAADFYALGRTMIQLLTGKYPPNLEDPITGKLNWRKWRNVDPQLADLLDEMVAEDVRSRPAHAAIIHKRLVKIVQVASRRKLLAPLQNALQRSSTPIFQQLAQFIQAIDQTINNLTQTVSNTTLLTVTAIFKVVFACIATSWAMLLTSIGSGVGAIAGFIFAYQTNLGVKATEILLRQLPNLAPTTPSASAAIVVYAIAGLGTAWGLTVAGCFGQKRRFFIASLMGVVSYGSGWIAWQFVKPQNSIEGLVIWMLISLSLLTLGIGIRHHQIIHALITALGSTTILAGLIKLGLPLPIPNPSELWQLAGFFILISILMNLCLGISYYLIMPFLRWLGWR